jgi:hypothetical protein
MKQYHHANPYQLKSMASDSKEITCEQHGSATATYVCSHLVADPIQRWHSARASDDNQWPDAWCDVCNHIFMRDGEWNDANCKDVELKMLCHHCYEHSLGTSVQRLGRPALRVWHAFVKGSHAELQVKQEELRTKFSLSRHKRWDWDQERAEIVFSNDGVPSVVANIDFVGSISTKSNTWLWSWANPHVLDGVRSRLRAVYELGEQKDFPHLVVPKWAAEEADGWDMAAVSARVLDAAGVYRTPTDNGFTFLLLSQVRFAQ